MKVQHIKTKKIKIFLQILVLLILIVNFSFVFSMGVFKMPPADKNKTNATNTTSDFEIEKYPVYSPNLTEEILKGKVKDPILAENKKNIPQPKNCTDEKADKNQKEKNCGDGVDNDCDNLIDCDDLDCKDLVVCNSNCDIDSRDCCKAKGGEFDSLNNKCCLRNFRDNWCGEELRCFNGVLLNNCKGTDYCFLGDCYSVSDDEEVIEFINKIEEDDYYDPKEKDAAKLFLYENDLYPEGFDTELSTKYNVISNQLKDLDMPIRLTPDEIRNVDNDIIVSRLDVRIEPKDNIIVRKDKINIKVYVKNIFTDDDDFRFIIEWNDSIEDEMIVKEKYGGKIEFWSSVYLSQGKLYKYKIKGYLSDGHLFYTSKERNILSNIKLVNVTDEEWKMFSTKEKEGEHGILINRTEYNELRESGKFLESNITLNPYGNAIVLDNNNKVSNVAQLPTKDIIRKIEILNSTNKEMDKAFLLDIKSRTKKGMVFDKRDIVSRTLNNNDLDIKFIDTLNNLDITKIAIRSKQNESENVTTFYVRLKPKKPLYNLSVYENIPKNVASLAMEIKYSGEPIVLDNDPLIMWYFQKVEDEVELSYEVEGNFDIEDLSSSKTIAIAESVGNPWYYILFPIVVIPFIVIFFLYFSGFREKKEKHFMIKKQMRKQKIGSSDVNINNLRDFIINSHELGIDPEDIEQNLVNIGWDREVLKKEINHIFNSK